jgi:hypothetical protein
MELRSNLPAPVCWFPFHLNALHNIFKTNRFLGWSSDSHVIALTDRQLADVKPESFSPRISHPLCPSLLREEAYSHQRHVVHQNPRGLVVQCSTSEEIRNAWLQTLHHVLHLDQDKHAPRASLSNIRAFLGNGSPCKPVRPESTGTSTCAVPMSI